MIPAMDIGATDPATLAPAPRTRPGAPHEDGGERTARGGVDFAAVFGAALARSGDARDSGEPGHRDDDQLEHDEPAAWESVAVAPAQNAILPIVGWACAAPPDRAVEIAASDEDGTRGGRAPETWRGEPGQPGKGDVTWWALRPALSGAADVPATREVERPSSFTWGEALPPAAARDSIEEGVTAAATGPSLTRPVLAVAIAPTVMDPAVVGEAGMAAEVPTHLAAAHMLLHGRTRRTDAWHAQDAPRMRLPRAARAGLRDGDADVADARQAASTLSAAVVDVLRSSIGSRTEHVVEPNGRHHGAVPRVEVSLDRTGDEMRAALDAERAGPAGVTPGESAGASAGGAGADGAATDAHPGDHPGARAAIAVPALNGSTPGAPVFEAQAASTIAALDPPIDDRQMADQLVQAIRVQLRGGVSDATVRLKPEHLGEVTISLRVEGSTVSATVQAEVAAVRHWIEANESTLRDNLSRAGLDLGQLVVRPDDRGAQQHPPRDSEQRRKGTRPRAHPTEARFTITV